MGQCTVSAAQAKAFIRDKLANKKVIVGQCTMSSSYAAGGDSFLPSSVGMSVFDTVIIMSSQLSGYCVGFNGFGSAVALGGNGNKQVPALIQLMGGTGAGGVDQQAWPYLQAAANAVTAAGGAAAAPAGSAYIATLAAANNTNALTIATQPDVARNVCITLYNGTTTGNCVASNYTVSGTFNGAPQTEVISFSAVSVTNAYYLTKYGFKPFETITSITPSAAQAASWTASAGIGCGLGLQQPLMTPAYNDVQFMNQQGVQITPIVMTAGMLAGTSSPTSGAVNPATNVCYFMNSSSGIAAHDNCVTKFLAGAQEIIPNSNFSGSGSYPALSPYFMAIGY